MPKRIEDFKQALQEDAKLRQRFISDMGGVLSEWGIQVPDDSEVSRIKVDSQEGAARASYAAWDSEKHWKWIK
jgi:hypothetical protein